MPQKIVLAITGASGAIYGVRLLQVLRAAGCEVHLSISSAGKIILEHELDLAVDLDEFDPAQLESARLFGDEDQPGDDGTSPFQRRTSIATAINGEVAQEPMTGELIYHHYQDFLASIASGSFLTDGMSVCPCSGGTLSAIAHGASNNLICRAADVHLKERRKLILVPRETPLSLIQLENMKRCAEAGAVILPAAPGFYHGVQTVRDLVDFVVARISDQLGVQHSLVERWGEPLDSEVKPITQG